MLILVTGATGNIGRMVVDRLQDSGVSVRALTVDPSRAALPPSVEVFEGYIGHPETVRPALDGVERMYLAPLPRTVADVCSMAHEAGVRHVVDLSGEKESWWGEVATAVEESGMTWTHLCAVEFMENCQIWADQIRKHRQVRDAYARSANAPIAMADIANVAAHCLLEDGHEGREYPLTGPESLTRAEQVRIIGRALGENVDFIEVSHREAVEELRQVMGEYADWYLQGKAELVDEPQPAVDTVARLIGEPATTFAEWADAHAGLFK